jgi:hypothetical protein
MAFISKRSTTTPLSTPLTEKRVQTLLGTYIDHARRYDAMIPGCMVQVDSEADMLGLRKSGFCDEFEIKLSKADFLKDRKKKVQYKAPPAWQEGEHDTFSGTQSERGSLAPWEKLKLTALADGDMIPNYFWYVIKAGIVSKSEVPRFAGLITVSDQGEIIVVRHPEKLHGRKLSFEQRYKFAALLNERFWAYRANGA